MPKLGFLRQQRLSDNNDIKRVFQTGKKLSDVLAKIFFCPNHYPYARLCITVAKKQVSHATNRNAIKRIIRESFRHQQAHLPPLDIVVLVYKPILSLDSKTIRDFMDKQWKKLSTGLNNRC